jgi:2-polyprenyl-3-methyl-5-hydroxy-6-metoxy-1,4-benzoquinol methylase
VPTAECFVCGSALAAGPGLYRRCRGCGLLATELPSREQIEAHYTAKFEFGNYELLRRYATPYQRIYEQMAGWLEFHPGARVLDVGCFTGDFLALLAERGADVYGLELQPEAVAIANQRLPGRIFQASADDSRFPPGRYDTITMLAVIEHVLDPRGLIASARERLALGGRLYLQTPNAGSLVARALGRTWPMLAPVEHIHLFSARALRLLLASEGFEVIRVRRHVKRLPASYVHAQFANYGGRRWQQVFGPLRLLGEVGLPFYAGEMFVAAHAAS